MTTTTLTPILRAVCLYLIVNPSNSSSDVVRDICNQSLSPSYSSTSPYTRANLIGTFITLQACLFTQPYGSLLFYGHGGFAWRTNPIACATEGLVLCYLYLRLAFTTQWDRFRSYRSKRRRFKYKLFGLRSENSATQIRIGTTDEDNARNAFEIDREGQFSHDATSQAEVAEEERDADTELPSWKVLSTAWAAAILLLRGAKSNTTHAAELGRLLDGVSNDRTSSGQPVDERRQSTNDRKGKGKEKEQNRGSEDERSHDQCPDRSEPGNSSKLPTDSSVFTPSDERRLRRLLASNALAHHERRIDSWAILAIVLVLVKVAAVGGIPVFKTGALCAVFGFLVLQALLFTLHATEMEEIDLALVAKTVRDLDKEMKTIKPFRLGAFCLLNIPLSSYLFYKIFFFDIRDLWYVGGILPSPIWTLTSCIRAVLTGAMSGMALGSSMTVTIPCILAYTLSLPEEDSDLKHMECNSPTDESELTSKDEIASNQNVTSLDANTRADKTSNENDSRGSHSSIDFTTSEKPGEVFDTVELHAASTSKYPPGNENTPSQDTAFHNVSLSSADNTGNNLDGPPDKITCETSHDRPADSTSNAGTPSHVSARSAPNGGNIPSSKYYKLLLRILYLSLCIKYNHYDRSPKYTQRRLDFHPIHWLIRRGYYRSALYATLVLVTMPTVSGSEHAGTGSLTFRFIRRLGDQGRSSACLVAMLWFFGLLISIATSHILFILSKFGLAHSRDSARESRVPCLLLIIFEFCRVLDFAVVEDNETIGNAASRKRIAILNTAITLYGFGLYLAYYDENSTSQPGWTAFLG